MTLVLNTTVTTYIAFIIVWDVCCLIVVGSLGRSKTPMAIEDKYKLVIVYALYSKTLVFR